MLFCFLKVKRKIDKFNAEWDSSIALNALAFVAIVIFVFSTGNKSDSEFIEGLKLPAYIISIMLSTLWIGVNIERTLVFKRDLEIQNCKDNTIVIIYRLGYILYLRGLRSDK
jgi:hypothetical protein